MKLVGSEWNPYLNQHQNMWIADTEDGITVDFDSASAVGSSIFVIATEATYMKNTVGKWQKCGTTEVIE